MARQEVKQKAPGWLIFSTNMIGGSFPFLGSCLFPAKKKHRFSKGLLVKRCSLFFPKMCQNRSVVFSMLSKKSWLCKFVDLHVQI